MKHNIFDRHLFAVLLAVVLFAVATAAQGNGFNFQGRLNDGANAANGAFDLQFRLYDAIAGGNQIGAQISRTNTVVINGVFSVTLDFGATAFNSPNAVFIEIAVRPNGNPNAYTILGPRQQLTVVPYAVRAATATLADNATNAANAVNAQNSVNSTNAQNAVNAQTAVNATSAANATTAQTAVNATNATNATNAVNATTAVTANNALNLGGFTASSFAKIDFQNPGNLLATGLLLTNDARQPSTGFGLVKAMIAVNSNGTILRCYNGITISTSGDCGFVIIQPLSGVFRINFGFPVSNRFVSVTPRYTQTGLGTNQNTGANYREFDTINIEVFTFESDSSDTVPRAFTIVVF